jgi:hypothetical protein
MSSRLYIPLATVAFALMFSANVSTARVQEKSLTVDQRQIVDTASAIFVAARADDATMANDLETLIERADAC